jgi:hypothetical protein
MNSIELSRFVGPTRPLEEVLTAFYQETPLYSNTMDDFLNLPVNDRYKPTRVEISKNDLSDNTIEKNIIETNIKNE